MHQHEITSLAGTKTKALILTGTPIKNRIDELFPLVNFLDFRAFPDIDRFVGQWHEFRLAGSTTTADLQARLCRTFLACVQSCGIRS